MVPFIPIDSGSESDTQEPIKIPSPAFRISDSDGEDAVTSAQSKEKSRPEKKSNMKKIFYRMNADSDQSDDEHVPEPPVDFGEEEEEEIATPSRPVPPLPKLPPLQENGSDDDDDFSAKMEEDIPEKKMVARKDKKDALAKKKQRGKKDKELSPTKAIKKSTVDAKTKVKAAKKQLVSKKDPVTKAKPVVEKKDDSPVKPKGTVKAKNTSKSIARTTAKASEVTKDVPSKAKSVKPKKSIEKGEQGIEKRPLSKKTAKTGAATKTFSKKSKAGVKSPSKVKSPVAEKKGKKEKVTASKQKSKKGKNDNSSKEMDEENSDKESESDSESEEIMRTPKSKLPILGTLACSTRDQNAQALLDHAVQQLGRYHVVPYGPDSEHVPCAYIVGSNTKRGWGLLQALASGIPLVSEDWLCSSISKGRWIPMEKFQSDRFGQSPRPVSKNSRSSRLLDGLRVKVNCEDKEALSIRRVLGICGARVAETRVDVVINDTNKKIDGGVNVTKKWLADSIESGVPIEYQPYIVGAA